MDSITTHFHRVSYIVLILLMTSSFQVQGRGIEGLFGVSSTIVAKVSSQLVGGAGKTASKQAFNPSSKASSEILSPRQALSGTAKVNLGLVYRSEGGPEEAPPAPQKQRATSPVNDAQTPEQQMQQARLHFIHFNLDTLRQEVAIGYGNTLETLSALYLCDRGDVIRFQHLLHDFYSGIFMDPQEPAEVKRRIDFILSARREDTSTCSP